MLETGTLALSATLGTLGRPRPYPLQRHGLVWGFGAGVVAMLVFGSPIAGFAFLVLGGCVGALWRHDDPPILVFCVGLQWIFIVTGYLTELITGAFPNSPQPPDSATPTLLSLLGLVAITLGVRAGLLFLMDRRAGADRAMDARYDVRKLFRISIAVSSLDWLVEVSATATMPEVAQIISQVFAFKAITVVLLLLIVARQRQGYRYAAIAMFVMMLPAWTSAHSAFVGVFILVAMAVITEWRPWERRHPVNLRFAAGLALPVILAFSLALLWQGGVKQSWRAKLGTMEGDTAPVSKMLALRDVVEQELELFDLGGAVASLIERLSGTYFFSFVLERVPAVVPYEDGALTLRALEHTTKPRLLFPDKPNLSSNSWLILKYAGLLVAGEEAGTSIGLTYMAEFYIDFGIPGMYVPLFIWGLLAGAAYGVVKMAAPSAMLRGAAIIALFPQPFASYEGEIAYMLAGLVQATVVFSVLLRLIGPVLHRYLLVRGDAAP